ncbi:MAG: pyridoxamine 5'-phosphate oxidase [Bacteroidetes bacterium]|nr:MAG: pyridoxamine 5'-phosphate oxidase [Bacteroidota bacterium]
MSSSDYILNEDTVNSNPIEQFKAWFQDAIDADLPYHDAMNLSTVSDDGKPSGRIVLLRGVDEKGFVFYTNYHSRKAGQLEGNPNAALTFFWLGLERQVRVEGSVTKTTVEQSDEYFASRSRGSQIGAAASPQSFVIESREDLDKRVGELITELDGSSVPRPQHWGGYCLKPIRIEFWNNVPDRLHDRLLFTLQDDSSWKTERLAP